MYQNIWGQAGAGTGTRAGAGAMMSNQKSLIRILNSRAFMWPLVARLFCILKNVILKVPLEIFRV